MKKSKSFRGHFLNIPNNGDIRLNGPTLKVGSLRGNHTIYVPVRFCLQSGETLQSRSIISASVQHLCRTMFPHKILFVNVLTICPPHWVDATVLILVLI